VFSGVAPRGKIVTIDEHVRCAVRQAKLSAEPFPYIYVTNLLPDDFYSALHASWPDFAEMNHPAATVGRLDFNGDGFDKPTSLAAEQMHNWRIFRDAMHGPFFEAALQRLGPFLPELGRELLAPDQGLLARRFRPPDTTFWKTAKPEHFKLDSEFITNRKDKSILAPHVDPPHFHFTVLVYFAPDTTRQHLGTIIYRQNGRGRARLPSENDQHPVLAQFAVRYKIKCTEAALLPFVPNAAAIFINGLHSWHGQQLDEEIHRQTYNSFYSVDQRYLNNALRPADVRRLAKHAAELRSATSELS
jgi:hypothetical protein